MIHELDQCGVPFLRPFVVWSHPSQHRASLGITPPLMSGDIGTTYPFLDSPCSASVTLLRYAAPTFTKEVRIAPLGANPLDVKKR